MSSVRHEAVDSLPAPDPWLLREDSLTASRTSSAVAFQGLLLTAYTFSFQADAQTQPVDTLRTFCECAGVAGAASNLVLTALSHRVKRILRRHSEARGGTEHAFVRTADHVLASLLSPAMLTSAVLAGMWVWLLFQ